MVEGYAAPSRWIMEAQIAIGFAKPVLPSAALADVPALAKCLDFVAQEELTGKRKEWRFMRFAVSASILSPGRQL